MVYVDLNPIRAGMVDADKTVHLSKSKWVARFIKEEVSTEWLQSTSIAVPVVKLAIE